jgi:sec-independent protein translocase protein TatA
MFNLGGLELGVIAMLVVLLFGVKRIPELGSGLGLGISNFRKAYRDGMAIDVTPESSTSGGKQSEATVNTETSTQGKKEG